MPNCNTILDYSRVRPRVLSSNGRALPSLRCHESVLVRAETVPDIASLKQRCQAEKKDGGKWLHDTIGDMTRRRAELNARRRKGESAQDLEAEAFSFAAIRDLLALQRALDFDVTYEDVSPDGLSRRSVTASAFALLAGSLAVADVNMAYESVPTVVEFLVQDLDDVQPHSEIGMPLDFGLTDSRTVPESLGETEEYKEVGAGEERYTVLHFKDGYQRAFSQEVIDRGGPRVFSELSDLGAGAREVMELFALRKIIDYDGSPTVSTAANHVMIRNRAAAALFSSTANTPSTRAPSGTRVNNNALVDTDNLETARARLASMRNSRSYPVANWMEVVLVPDALWVTAHKMLNSAFQPAVFNEVNFFGPDGPGGPINLISTPMLDLLTTTHWYAGRPQKQFVRKWKQRPEIATYGGRGTEAFLRTREGFRIRIGWDMTVGARDHVFWIENSNGTAGAQD